MSENKENIEDQLPESLRKIQASADKEGDLKIPQDYFDSMRSELMIKAKSVSVNLGEFKTPDDYFVTQEKSIRAAIGNKKKGGNVKPLYRRLLPYAVAASIIGAGIILVFTNKGANSDQTFASAIEGTELDIDDMEYFASSDDYYDLYIDELNDVSDDQELSVDSVSDESDDTAFIQINNRIDSIKPLDDKTTLTWDELSEEDLLQYLFENGDNELLNDLN